MFPQEFNELWNSETLVSNLDAIPHYLLRHPPFYFCVGPTMQPRIMCASDESRFLHRPRQQSKEISQFCRIKSKPGRKLPKYRPQFLAEAKYALREKVR